MPVHSRLLRQPGRCGVRHIPRGVITIAPQLCGPDLLFCLPCAPSCPVSCRTLSSDDLEERCGCPYARVRQLSGRVCLLPKGKACPRAASAGFCHAPPSPAAASSYAPQKAPRAAHLYTDLRMVNCCPGLAQGFALFDTAQAAAQAAAMIAGVQFDEVRCVGTSKQSTPRMNAGDAHAVSLEILARIHPYTPGAGRPSTNLRTRCALMMLPGFPARAAWTQSSTLRCEMARKSECAAAAHARLCFAWVCLGFSRHWGHHTALDGRVHRCLP